MSDNELDDLLVQLKDSYKKNRQAPSNENHLHNLLKRIDTFIHQRQNKLHNHQSRLDDLQRDLLLSEKEISTSRAEIERKDFEVHQLHQLLNKAEQTTQSMMTKYDNEVQRLMKQLCNVQHEYERLKSTQKRQTPSKISNDLLLEIERLRERNKTLEAENQQLNKKIQSQQRERDIHLIQSIEHSNTNRSDFIEKIKSLETQIELYKRHIFQQESEIKRLEKTINDERDQWKTILEKSRRNSPSEDLDKIRYALTQSEHQCHLLRLELQRVQTEKEILKVQLVEQKMSGKSEVDIRDSDSKDFQIFLRHELQIDAERTNKLINFWNEKKMLYQNRIRQLSDDLEQSQQEKRSQNFNDRSKEISHLNETILHAKRDVNQLQMELTDKNTTIYNLYKKIECLEQALTISKQRMNAQLNEIQDLRTKQNGKSPSIRDENDGMNTDGEDRRHSLIRINRHLRTSSPIKSGSFHKHFHKYDGESTPSMNTEH